MDVLPSPGTVRPGLPALQNRRPLAEIGVLGLGTGTIAAYGQAGERITFYEIDPLVERIARNPKYFTYLADCPAKVEVIMGDARLSLVHGPPRQFDLLVVDAFSSDYLPVHLITREALQIYLQRLAERGLLVINISSRYFDMAPILGRLAKDAGLAGRVCADLNRPDAVALGRWGSAWERWPGAAKTWGSGSTIPAGRRCRPRRPLWTDDFSNIVDAIDWHFSWKTLLASLRGGSRTAAAHYNRGVVLMSRGRTDEAVAQYQRALEIRPDFPEAHNNLGNALPRRGRIDEAIAEYEKALETRPDYADAHNNLGSALVSRGQIDEAITHCRKALEVQPDCFLAHVNLGLALAGRKRFDEAASHFRDALRLQPGHAPTHCNLAGALAEGGRFDEAIAEYEKALRIEPDFPQARRNLDAVASLRETMLKSLAERRKSLRARPDDVILLNDTAWMLATNPNASVRNGEEAVQLARRAVKLSDGRQPESLDTLAAAYAEAGRFPEAVQTRARRSTLPRGSITRRWRSRSRQRFRRTKPAILFAHRGPSNPKGLHVKDQGVIGLSRR